MLQSWLPCKLKTIVYIRICMDNKGYLTIGQFHPSWQLRTQPWLLSEGCWWAVSDHLLHLEPFFVPLVGNGSESWHQYLWLDSSTFWLNPSRNYFDNEDEISKREGTEWNRSFLGRMPKVKVKVTFVCPRCVLFCKDVIRWLARRGTMTSSNVSSTNLKRFKNKWMPLNYINFLNNAF